MAASESLASTTGTARAIPRRHRAESYAAYMHRLVHIPQCREYLEDVSRGKTIEGLPFAVLCRRLQVCASDTSIKGRFDRFNVLLTPDIGFLWHQGQSLFPLVRLLLPLQVSRRAPPVVVP
jgi:hypothetical protein